MEASRRGWWSYTDLVSYWNTTPTTDLMASASSQTAKVSLCLCLRNVPLVNDMSLTDF